MSVFTFGVLTMPTDTSRPRTVADFDMGDYVFRRSPGRLVGYVKGLDSRGLLLVEDADENEHWVKPERFERLTSRKELVG